MSNSIEEGVLLDIDNPGHTDAGKVAVLGGGALGMAVFIALSVWAPQLGTKASAILGVGVLAVTAYIINRRVTAQFIAKEAARLHAERAAHEAETEALIAQMKKERTL